MDPPRDIQHASMQLKFAERELTDAVRRNDGVEVEALTREIEGLSRFIVWMGRRTMGE